MVSEVSDRVADALPVMRAPSAPRLFLPRLEAQPGEVPSLNGLRAVSISLVLLAHAVDNKLFPGGLGVLIFFVISGFLITRLLFLERRRTGRVSLPAFYARRLFRLYPVITVYTVVVIALFLALDLPINAVEPASALFYFANYLYSTPHFNDHMPFGIFWSLSVEEHFYLLLPSLFFLLAGRKRTLAVIVGIACLACLVARLVVLHVHPELTDSYVLYFRTQYRLDSIGFGVLLAIFCETEEWRWIVRACARPAVVAIAAAALFASLAIRDPWFREGIRYSLQSAAVAVLIAALLFGERYRLAQKVLNWRLADWVGRLSYSLYVWHMLMLFLIAKLFGQEFGAVGSAALGLAASFLVATVSYSVVESPLRTIPQRFRRWRQGHAPVVSTDETMAGLGRGPAGPFPRVARPAATGSRWQSS